MESREAVLWLLAHMGRKGSNRAGILGLKQGVRIEIAFCRGIVELLFLQRFECPDHLTPAPQHKIADWPPTKILDTFGQFRADADAGTELLVCRFKTRGNVDRIAIGGVVEKPTAAEISDNRRSRVNTDARHAECDTLLLPALTEALGKFVQSKCAGDGSGGMVGLLTRCTEKDMQCIAN